MPSIVPPRDDAAVHPLAAGTPLAAITALREYRVIHEPGALRVEAVFLPASRSGKRRLIEVARGGS